MKKAIFGIIGGLILAGLAWSGGAYFDPQPHHHNLWLALSLAAWPVLAFGVFFLAQWRGYPGEVGLAPFGVGLIVHIALVHWTHNPVIYPLGVAFAVALPVLLVTALPPREMPHIKPHKPIKKSVSRV